MIGQPRQEWKGTGQKLENQGGDERAFPKSVRPAYKLFQVDRKTCVRAIVLSSCLRYLNCLIRTGKIIFTGCN